MGFAGYVTVCVQLYCVNCHCLALHVSAYMAIFNCVGYFYFINLKESASLVFAFFLHVVTLCTFPFMFFLFCFSFVNVCCCFLRVCLSACKHKWKRAEVTAVARYVQKTSEADSFRHMK
jgi:hypothetical protein